MRSAKFLSASLAVIAIFQAVSVAEAITIPSGPFTYSQDFNSLTSTSWTNDSTLPGWSLFRRPAPGIAIGSIALGTGTSNSGSFYSFGSGGEFALGGVGSGGSYWGSPGTGTVAGWMAVAFQNDTGTTLDQFTVGYDGEQWRDGGNTTPQTMVLEYGFGSTFGSVSSWIAPGGTFDFTSPHTTATGAVDGNSSANRVAELGGLISGLTWNSGDTLWIRWIENNDAGNDHGLAVDNFSFGVPGSGGDGNNSIITAAIADLPLGRVMLNQVAFGNIDLTKAGSSETDYTAAPATTVLHSRLWAIILAPVPSRRVFLCNSKIMRMVLRRLGPSPTWRRSTTRPPIRVAQGKVPRIRMMW